MLSIKQNKLATLASFVLVLAGCVAGTEADSAQPTVTVTVTETVTPIPAPGSSEPETTADDSSSGGTSGSIEDSLEVGDFVITLNSVESVEEDVFGSGPENGAFIIVDLTIRNDSSTDETFSSLLGVELRDGDGYLGDFSFFLDLRGTLDGDIQAGGELRGQVGFDVGPGPYTLEITPSLFGDTVYFNFD